MDNKLTVQDLLCIIEQYKEELVVANEQKMLYKALLVKQIKINEQLRKGDENEHE